MPRSAGRSAAPSAGPARARSRRRRRAPAASRAIATCLSPPQCRIRQDAPASRSPGLCVAAPAGDERGEASAGSALRPTSQIASASAASFLLRLTYAFTYAGGINRTSCPSAFAGPVVCCRARLHADQARLDGGEEVQQLTAANLARPITVLRRKALKTSARFRLYNRQIDTRGAPLWFVY